jgi:hypothetical protein
MPIVLKRMRGSKGIKRGHIVQASSLLTFAASLNKTASLAVHRLTGWIYLGTAY